MTGFLKCFKVNSFLSSILGVRPEGPDKEISTSIWVDFLEGG